MFNQDIAWPTVGCAECGQLFQYRTVEESGVAARLFTEHYKQAHGGVAEVFTCIDCSRQFYDVPDASCVQQCLHHYVVAHFPGWDAKQNKTN